MYLKYCPNLELFGIIIVQKKFYDIFDTVDFFRCSLYRTEVKFKSYIFKVCSTIATSVNNKYYEINDLHD